MDATALCFTPATELARLIRRRELSPVELVDAVLARIEAVDGVLHAFITLDGDRARDAARQAESVVASGGVLGALHGLPVSIKDLEDTAGLRTTYGSKHFADYVPAEDGPVSARVKAAGGVLLGKTNTPNFGHKDMCDNLVAPTTRNPWDTTRTPGGSSGGAGAAIAAGLGPLAHGSDGAGSIRIPSALCGVFGFKPSFGRVPYYPSPDLWAARSHSGPMARTVRDAALMLSAIAGPDLRDPLSVDGGPVDYVAACDGGIAGLRVAWSPDFGYATVDPEVRQIAERAARRFEELGCVVEEVVPGWDDPRPAAEALWFASFTWRHGARHRQHPDWTEPSMAEMIEAGYRLTSEEIGEATLGRTRFHEQARPLFERYDLLLSPQMPCTAWPHDQPGPVIGGELRRSIFDRVPFTFPFNMTGWPAATVPCGFAADGLPVALQIASGWHRDTLCLRAAAAFEQLQPWADRRPAI